MHAWFGLSFVSLSLAFRLGFLALRLAVVYICIGFGLFAKKKNGKKKRKKKKKQSKPQDSNNTDISTGVQEAYPPFVALHHRLQIASQALVRALRDMQSNMLCTWHALLQLGSLSMFSSKNTLQQANVRVWNPDRTGSTHKLQRCGRFYCDSDTLNCMLLYVNRVQVLAVLNTPRTQMSIQQSHTIWYLVELMSVPVSCSKTATICTKHIQIF